MAKSLFLSSSHIQLKLRTYSTIVGGILYPTVSMVQHVREDPLLLIICYLGTNTNSCHSYIEFWISKTNVTLCHFLQCLSGHFSSVCEERTSSLIVAKWVTWSNFSSLFFIYFLSLEPPPTSGKPYCTSREREPRRTCRKQKGGQSFLVMVMCNLFGQNIPPFVDPPRPLHSHNNHVAQPQARGHDHPAM